MGNTSSQAQPEPSEGPSERPATPRAAGQDTEKTAFAVDMPSNTTSPAGPKQGTQWNTVNGTTIVPDSQPPPGAAPERKKSSKSKKNAPSVLPDQASAAATIVERSQKGKKRKRHSSQARQEESVQGPAESYKSSNGRPQTPPNPMFPSDKKKIKKKRSSDQQTLDSVEHTEDLRSTASSRQNNPMRVENLLVSPHNAISPKKRKKSKHTEEHKLQPDKRNSVQSMLLPPEQALSPNRRKKSKGGDGKAHSVDKENPLPWAVDIDGNFTADKLVVEDNGLQPNGMQNGKHKGQNGSSNSGTFGSTSAQQPSNIHGSSGVLSRIELPSHHGNDATETASTKASKKSKKRKKGHKPPASDELAIQDTPPSRSLSNWDDAAASSQILSESHLYSDDHVTTIPAHSEKVHSNATPTQSSSKRKKKKVKIHAAANENSNGTHDQTLVDSVSERRSLSEEEDGTRVSGRELSPELGEPYTRPINRGGQRKGADAPEELLHDENSDDERLRTPDSRTEKADRLLAFSSLVSETPEPAPTKPLDSMVGAKNDNVSANDEGSRQNDGLPEGFHRQGPFTPRELEILNHAVEQYRQMADISQHEINAMIQETKRGKIDTNLWESIFEALQHRSRPSVSKVTRRKFHNYSKRGKWTEEEDEELRVAYAKYKDSWKKIGLEIDRMPEDCRDRWRNYVVCKDNRTEGAWLGSEEAALWTAWVEACERLTLGRKNEAIEKGLVFNPADIDYERDVNWSLVSKQLGGKRSRLQCMYKFKQIRDREQREKKKEEERAATGDTEDRKSWRIKAAEVNYKRMLPGDKFKILKEIASVGAEDERALNWTLISQMYADGRWSSADRKVVLRESKNMMLQHDPSEFKEHLETLLGQLEKRWAGQLDQFFDGDVLQAGSTKVFKTKPRSRELVSAADDMVDTNDESPAVSDGREMSSAAQSTS